ncbi:MAG TPA: ABC transporter ATP-binding protein [Gaiellaceae bacterium]|nr:ABC transporter ATP-binding protein [Gaiellaceae bacterium]
MAALTVDQVAVPLRSFELELTLDVDRTVALVGPSGAGKSTLLRAIAGLVRPARGRIVVDGHVWFDAGRGIQVPPDRRQVGLVFQDYALFPHLTVRENVEFARRHRADEYLERLGIRALEHARPGELSGGERQRVALARALARDPRVLLLDEPVSALDAHTKAAVRAEIHDVLAGLELPAVLVSHDFEDAAALAERVSVIVDGRLRQSGTPADLVARPADPFVASFTGANLLAGRAEASRNGSTRVILDDGTPVTTADPAHGDVVLAVYPWDVTVGTAAPHDSAMNVIGGPIRSIAELGNRVRVALGPITAEITSESLARLGLVPGQTAYASFKATGTRVVSDRQA